MLLFTLKPYTYRVSIHTDLIITINIMSILIYLIFISVIGNV